MNPRELFAQATHALVTNRLRSALTLVGIILGVASILAVMTALALVQATFEHEMSVLGSQTFQVQKWPAGGFASDAVRRGGAARAPPPPRRAPRIRPGAPRGGTP